MYNEFVWLEHMRLCVGCGVGGFQLDDWYLGFIVEEMVDRIVVHVDGWEHK